jgi:hypothetical protein
VALLDRLRPWKPPPAGVDQDLLILRQLEGRGANLGRPRHVIHFLSFLTEADARHASAVIENAGWQVTLEPRDSVGQDWSLRAEGMRVVDLTTIGAFRSSFERIATERGGTYEGWEAAAKP